MGKRGVRITTLSTGLLLYRKDPILTASSPINLDFISR